MPKIPDAAEKQILLTKFGALISSVRRPCHDEGDLLKWLVARSYDVEKAADMYKKSMKWRKDNRVDFIIEEFQVPEVMARYYPGGLFGEAKDGLPLSLDMIGLVDIRGLLMSVKRADMIKVMIRNVENLHEHFMEQSKKHGRRIDQCVHIIDMTGFGIQHMWKPCLDFYIDIIRMLENNYPESLKTTFIINAPKVFNIGYNILKRFIDKGTAAKFHVLDSNWHDTLFEVIDPAQLPVKFGGTCTDPDGDPGCSSRLNWGGTVPKSCYRSRDELLPPDKCQVADVKRGGTLELDYEVEKPNTIISWLFATEDKPLKFGVMRRTGEPGSVTEIIQPVQQVACHMVPEDGSLICEKPDIYVLVFDNSDNYLTRRKLLYRIEVTDMSNETLGQESVQPQE